MEQELPAPADFLLWTCLRREKSQYSCPSMLLAVRRAICTTNKVWFSLDHILNFSNVRDILALLRTVWNRAVHLFGVVE